MRTYGTSPEFVQIRPAVPEDLEGMARVHVDGWKTAYRGIVADDVLDSLTQENDITSGFGRGLRTPQIGERQFVATSSNEGIIGYAIAGPNRDRSPRFAGELEAIYVLSSHRNGGVGSRLVGEVARFLADCEMDSMVVWVLLHNPYRSFYEHLGGTRLGERVGLPHPLGGGPLTEVSYGWSSLSRLASL
jgi:GNAT superfamily N-acetyltransferase